MSVAFDLASYEDVRTNADGICRRLADGSMPCDARWPPEQDRDRVAVDKLGACGGRDRLRLGQGRLALVLQELRPMAGGHPGVRRLREVRNCRQEEASVLVLEAHRLADCD